MRIVITASGGGHTAFALALARRLIGRSELYFVVRKGDELSKKRLSRYGEVVETSSGRGPFDSLLKAVPRLGLAFLESLVKGIRGDLVVCMGHNHSVPPTIASWLRGAKALALEDIVRFGSRGRAVSMVSRIADAVALHWEEQTKLYPDKGVVVGPVYEDRELDPWDGGYILVTAGTYGFKELFDAVAEAADRLGRVVGQTGRVDPELYKDRVWRAFSITHEFHRWLAGASVVIAHAGVTPATAALSYGKPVITMLNPRLRLTAREWEAKLFASKIGAIYLEDLTPDSIIRAVERARKTRPPSIPNGADRLAELILSTIEGESRVG